MHLAWFFELGKFKIALKISKTYLPPAYKSGDKKGRKVKYFKISHAVFSISIPDV